MNPTTKDWKAIWVYFEAVIEYHNTYNTTGSKIKWESSLKQSESSILRNVLHIHMVPFTDAEWTKMKTKFKKVWDDCLIQLDWDTQKRWLRKELDAIIADRVS